MPLARLDHESSDYTKRRDELQAAEVALRDQCERLAELRRQLPLDTIIEDELFEEVRDGQRAAVALSELFVNREKPLVLMHFMYGKDQVEPCPMCTMWADGYDGAMPHMLQRLNFAVFVAGDPAVFEAYGRSRGWRNVRVVSASASNLKRRLGFETESGAQLSGYSVFARRNDGTLIHALSQSAILGEDGGRGMDLLSPVWNFFDTTPDGRGDFMPSRQYDGD